jgi:hypothetical protein
MYTFFLFLAFSCFDLLNILLLLKIISLIYRYVNIFSEKNVEKCQWYYFLYYLYNDFFQEFLEVPS